MPKPPLKTQQDLEKHLRVYIDVLKEEGHKGKAVILEQAIDIIYEHYYAVLPNQCRMKKALLGALNDGGMLSVDDIMDAVRKERLITDRRRINTVLSKMKRDDIITNPIRGHWVIKNKGKQYVEKARSKDAKK